MSFKVVSGGKKWNIHTPHPDSKKWNNEVFHLTAAYKYIISLRICFDASCTLLFLQCMLLLSWLHSLARHFIFFIIIKSYHSFRKRQRLEIPLRKYMER